MTAVVAQRDRGRDPEAGRDPTRDEPLPPTPPSEGGTGAGIGAETGAGTGAETGAGTRAETGAETRAETRAETGAETRAETRA